MALAQSALVILVPEAEPLVGPFRAKHDPSASAGMPAHVTLLFPFRQPGQIDDGVLQQLRACFARFRRFRFSLTEVRRFEANVLYLAPEPRAPFRDITRAIWKQFPDTPPYGGAFADVIPHLTVAHVAGGERLDPIADAFARACRAKLPLHATANKIALLDNLSGRWQVRSEFALATQAAAP